MVFDKKADKEDRELAADELDLVRGAAAADSVPDFSWMQGWLRFIPGGDGGAFSAVLSDSYWR
jgi:hypothetical protein